MTKELALKEGLTDAGAIDGDEGGGRAFRVVVDSPSDEFLTGAAFALQQHDAVIPGHCIRNRYYAAKHTASAYQGGFRLIRN